MITYDFYDKNLNLRKIKNLLKRFNKIRKKRKD